MWNSSKSRLRADGNREKELVRKGFLGRSLRAGVLGKGGLSTEYKGEGN